MRNRNLLLAILFLIGLSLGFIKFVYPGSSLPPSPSPVSVSPSPASLSLDEWQDYSNDFFSLKYPPEASVSASSGPDWHEWQISSHSELMASPGDQSESVTDGYAVSVRIFDSLRRGSAKIQADADREEVANSCGEESLSVATASAIADIQTLSFRGGCLNNAIYHYFETEDGLYRVRSLSSGKADKTVNYEKITSEIINSLKLKSLPINP